MTLTDLFWGIGDFLATILTPLDADFPFTFLINTGIVVFGFLGLFYWLNLQRKFNNEAENNPNQRK